MDAGPSYSYQHDLKTAKPDKRQVKEVRMVLPVIHLFSLLSS